MTQTTSPVKQNEFLSSNRYPSFEGLVQPRMRFKPRTDLERIFDSLNESPFYRKLDRDILQRHLAKLTNTQTVKVKNKNKAEEKEEDNLSEIADKDLNENDPYHQIYKHYIKGKKHKKNKSVTQISMKKKLNYINHINRSNAIFKRRFNPERRMELNDEAKEVLSDFHYKTHFKAAVEVAEKDVISSSHNNLKKINITSPDIKGDNLIKQFEDEYNQEQLLLKERNNHLYENTEYHKNFNPYTVNNPKPSLTKESKEILTDLINIEQECDEEIDYFTRLNNKKIANSVEKPQNSRDYVRIQGQEYNKKNQMDVIARLVLNNCNIYHEKSKYNNTRLKSRKGKLECKTY